MMVFARSMWLLGLIYFMGLGLVFGLNFGESLKVPLRVNDVLPALPRQILWPVLNNLHSTVDLLPSFVGSVSPTNGSIEWKGACFFDNEARLEFTGGDRGLGGGVLHLKVWFIFKQDEKEIQKTALKQHRVLRSATEFKYGYKLVENNNLRPAISTTDDIEGKKLKLKRIHLTCCSGRRICEIEELHIVQNHYPAKTKVEHGFLHLNLPQNLMLIETQSWPYDFPLSEDFPHADQRGTVSGRLLVRDKYINEQLMTANFAFVGLAAPGNVGSWQRENKILAFMLN
ncbi:unnamed protein product [Camellia sinensis]